MDKAEKKEFIGMICEAIEEVVTPQFDDMHKRFDKMQQEMDSGFTNVDKKFDKMQNQIDSRFNNVNARLDLMQKDIEWIKEEIKNIYERLDEFPTRVEFEIIKKRVKSMEVKLGIISR